MSVRKVNLLALEPGETVDDFGFFHREQELRPLLGSEAIDATLYTAEAGRSIWPYHYHLGIEEWVYVISGEPLLRDPHGARTLKAGDSICFPVGGAGAHTLQGPGRFVIFASGREPRMSVYPDSDKVSTAEGMLLRSSAVDYWYGEGDWDPSADPGPRPRRVREFPEQPIINLHSLAVTRTPPQGARPGYAARVAPLAQALGAEMLGATIYELDPGEGSAPYHYHSNREEWLIVLSGEPALRHVDGEDDLRPGDVVCFSDGPGGAHRAVNDGAAPARLLILSTVALPVTAHYPDSGKVLIREADGSVSIFREADAVGFWDGD